MTHAFTVDLEDWYDGIPITAERKAAAERRLNVGTGRLLDLLARHNTRATFFALSSIVEKHPSILRQIADAGHEIGSHGLSHDLVYEMGPERFREETRASIHSIQDCVGQPVTSYRAAYFSITKKSLWALETLVEEGIRFDSSIFPVNNWRYGIADFSRRPVVVETGSGPIIEFPISTRCVFSRNFPTTGGAYFRIYPYWLSRQNLKAAERENLPVAFYLHPWELDPEHPRVRFKGKAMVTHYCNLGSTAAKLEKLLQEFQFTTLSEVLTGVFPGTNS